DHLPPRVSALRLEALTHPSLPNKGPGRHTSGNFQVAEITLHKLSTTNNAVETPLTISRSWDDYHWEGGEIEHAVRKSPGNFWHVWGRLGQNHWGILQLREPVEFASGDRLVVRIKHTTREKGINLGRFALAVTDRSDPRDRAELSLLARSGADSWARLAAAVSLAGDPSRAAAYYGKAWDRAWDGKVKSEIARTLSEDEPGLAALVALRPDKRMD